MKYVLIYLINDYPESGGGLAVEYFKSAEDMHARANELLLVKTAGIDNRPYHESVKGLAVSAEFGYKPVQVATEYQPVEVE